MRLKEGFKIRRIAQDTLLVPESARLVDFNKMIVLNSTAAYLWEELCGKDFTTDDIVALLLSKYDVDEELARKDAENLLVKWEEACLME